MKMRMLAPAAVGALLLAGFATANAEDVALTLSGDQEVPAVTTEARGTGEITIGEDKSVKGSIKTSGLVGTAAHIHEAAPGKNGPPIITLEKKGDSEWAVPAGAKLSDAQYESFKAGNLYVNVHSAEHKPGEYYRLTRNDSYWGEGEPRLDEIVYRVLPDRAAAAGALERESDRDHGQPLLRWREGGAGDDAHGRSDRGHRRGPDDRAVEGEE